MNSLLAEGYWNGHMSGWNSPWMWLAMAAFWILVIGAGIWFARNVARGERPEDSGRAREILADRYARGELDTEDYRQRLDQLTDSAR